MTDRGSDALGHARRHAAVHGPGTTGRTGSGRTHGHLRVRHRRLPDAHRTCRSQCVDGRRDHRGDHERAAAVGAAGDSGCPAARRCRGSEVPREGPGTPMAERRSGARSAQVGGGGARGGMLPNMSHVCGDGISPRRLSSRQRLSRLPGSQRGCPAHQRRFT